MQINYTPDSKSSSMLSTLVSRLKTSASPDRLSKIKFDISGIFWLVKNFLKPIKWIKNDKYPSHEGSEKS